MDKIRKEFFGESLEEALDKASSYAGIPADEMEYTQIQDDFYAKSNRVVILVEIKPKEAEKKVCGISKEEKEFRDSGGDDWAVFITKSIFEKMGYKANVTATGQKNQVKIDVEMVDEAFDQRRGDARDFRSALQHVVNRAYFADRREERRYIIDIDGLLDKRSQDLKGMVGELEESVAKIKKPINIHLMDSQDRRVIHLGIADNRKAKTNSLGDRTFRILSVEPKEHKDEKGDKKE
jgi:predicted RNA-binding protein Jag